MKKTFNLILILICSISIFSCNTKTSDEADSVVDSAEAIAEDADQAMDEMAEDVSDAVDELSDANDEIPIVEEITDGELNNNEVYTNEETGEVVYTFLMEEDRPTFKGSLSNFLSENLEYPLKARENESEGTVIVDFVVGSDGVVRDARIIKPLEDATLNSEALRVISTMPPWNPGVKDGAPVSYKYSLPIQFQLRE